MLEPFWWYLGTVLVYAFVGSFGVAIGVALGLWAEERETGKWPGVEDEE